jgi:hypothetical protein
MKTAGYPQGLPRSGIAGLYTVVPAGSAGIQATGMWLAFHGIWIPALPAGMTA